MENKKSKKADLESKRFIFLEIGIVLTLSFALMAFEWGNSVIEEVDIFADNLGTEEIIEEIIPITRDTYVPPEPIVPEEIIVVPDEEDIEEFVFEGIDVDERTEIDLTFLPEEPEASEDVIFIIVEDMPTYQEGDLNKFHKHIQSLVEYPVEAQNNGIQGKVYVDFVVDKTGKVTHLTINKSPHDVLSEAVLEAFKHTNGWKPGKQRGIPVNVRFSIPVIFKLYQ